MISLRAAMGSRRRCILLSSRILAHGFASIVRGDVEGLGDCLSRLAGDRRLAERMGRRARTTAEERYDWKGVARRLADLYGEVVR